jgi:hypothetical protein
MDKQLILFFLLFSVLTTNAQIDKRDINLKLLKFYPADLAEAFVDKPVFGQTNQMEIIKDDTINYKVHFDKQQISSLIFDSTKITFSYHFGRLSRIDNFLNDSIIDQTRIIKILPFIWVFNDGLTHTGFRIFGKTYKMKQVSSLKTISKRKVNYKRGRVHKIKNYGWQTISQRCYFSDYQKFDYPNDTTVLQKTYDSNDSLAFETRLVFDQNGEILETELLTRKRASGWGIDVTYYTYDAKQIDKTTYDYKYDTHNNWIEKFEYFNDTIRSFEIRKIIYKD